VTIEVCDVTRGDHGNSLAEPKSESSSNSSSSSSSCCCRCRYQVLFICCDDRFY